MKRTGDDTVMIEMPGSRFYEVRGEAMICDLIPDGDEPMEYPEFERLKGKRVLILELVDQEKENI